MNDTQSNPLWATQDAAPGPSLLVVIATIINAAYRSPKTRDTSLLKEKLKAFPD